MYLLIIIILVAFDQLIKWWVRTHMNISSSIPIIKGFLHITYVQNRGAAFGMMQDKKWILVGLTSLVILFLLYLIFIKSYPTYTKWVLSLIVAGAIGNLIDRVFLSYVVDMFDVRGIWSYVFNFADICVVVGTITLVGLILLDRHALDPLSVHPHEKMIDQVRHLKEQKNEK